LQRQEKKKRKVEGDGEATNRRRGKVVGCRFKLEKRCAKGRGKGRTLTKKDPAVNGWFKVQHQEETESVEKEVKSGWGGGHPQLCPELKQESSTRSPREWRDSRQKKGVDAKKNSKYT